MGGRKRKSVSDEEAGTSKRFAPPHVLEAQDFLLPSATDSPPSPFQGTLPNEVIARIGGMLDVRSLARLEQTSVALRDILRLHVWPTLRLLKLSHHRPPIPPPPSRSVSLPLLAGPSNHPTASHESVPAPPPPPLFRTPLPPEPTPNRLYVAISVGNQYLEEVVSERGLVAVVKRLRGLRSLTFGVQARIQRKADYEAIYHDDRAKEYREHSARLMKLVFTSLPKKQLRITSLTVGSFFEMSPFTYQLISRLSKTLRNITMSFRWLHKTATEAEVADDVLHWQSIWEAIKSCHALQVLKVYKTNMSALGAGPVLEAVSEKPALSRLCLVCEGFSGSDMAAIIAAIPPGNLKVLFMEPNGGSALDELRLAGPWRRAGRTPPADPSLHLGHLRKFGFSSRDHLPLPRTIHMLPSLWEILIVGRTAGDQLRNEVKELTVEYLHAKRLATDVKPICIRIHTEDDRWRLDDDVHLQRDNAFGEQLQIAVREKVPRVHTVRMEPGPKWGFRAGNASVVVTGEKPTPPPHPPNNTSNPSIEF